MKSWRDTAYAVVDVETTGLDVRRDEVLSIGIIDVIAGRVQLSSALYRQIRPRAMPGPESVVIHGIRPKDAAEGEDPESAGREVISRLHGRVLAAHVAWIERGFLGAWLGPLGFVVPKRFVDTEVLVHRAMTRPATGDNQRHISLHDAASSFGVPEHCRHHALGDAVTAAQLLVVAASRLSADREASVSSLLDPPTPMSRLHQCLRGPASRRRLTGRATEERDEE